MDIRIRGIIHANSKERAGAGGKGKRRGSLSAYLSFHVGQGRIVTDPMAPRSERMVGGHRTPLSASS